MRKNTIFIITLCLIFTAIFVVQVSATERSYFYGCSDCGESVTAFCDGLLSRNDNCSHEYNKVLWFEGNICIYSEIIHSTTEYCDVVSTHVNSGDNVYAYEGHTYDDVGKNVCGQEDVTPCSIHSVAYRSS